MVSVFSATVCEAPATTQRGQFSTGRVKDTERIGPGVVVFAGKISKYA